MEGGDKGNGSNMNKKGIKLVGSTVIEIVVALVVILLLGYLVVQVGGIFIEKNKLDRAKVQLEKIVEIVNQVQKDGKTKKVEVFSPDEGWYLMTFPFEFPEGECRGEKDCLCICSELFCKELRKCEGFDFEVKATRYTQSFRSGGYYTTYVYDNVIPLPPVDELLILKRGELIEIEKGDSGRGLKEVGRQKGF